MFEIVILFSSKVIAGFLSLVMLSFICFSPIHFASKVLGIPWKITAEKLMKNDFILWWWFHFTPNSDCETIRAEIRIFGNYVCRLRQGFCASQCFMLVNYLNLLDFLQNYLFFSKLFMPEREISLCYVLRVCFRRFIANSCHLYHIMKRRQGRKK